MIDMTGRRSARLPVFIYERRADWYVLPAIISPADAMLWIGMKGDLQVRLPQ
jgi:hypothetical protein